MCDNSPTIPRTPTGAPPRDKRVVVRSHRDTASPLEWLSAVAETGYRDKPCRCAVTCTHTHTFTRTHGIIISRRISDASSWDWQRVCAITTLLPTCLRVCVCVWTIILGCPIFVRMKRQRFFTLGSANELCACACLYTSCATPEVYKYA